MLPYTKLNTMILTCLIGSGTLFIEQTTTSLTAVSRDIFCPTDTYTGLDASSDVFRACKTIKKCNARVLKLFQFSIHDTYSRLAGDTKAIVVTAIYAWHCLEQATKWYTCNYLQLPKCAQMYLQG